MYRHREEETGEAPPRTQTDYTTIREWNPKGRRPCKDRPPPHRRSIPNRDQPGMRQSDQPRPRQYRIRNRVVAERADSPSDIRKPARAPNMRSRESIPLDSPHNATRPPRLRNTRRHDLRNSVQAEEERRCPRRAVRMRYRDRKDRCNHSFDTPSARSCPMDSSRRSKPQLLRDRSSLGYRAQSIAWSLHIDRARGASRNSLRE
jgi:hypothetical protein